MPNYKIEESWDGQHFSIKSTPTPAETGVMIGSIAALLVGNYQAKRAVTAQKAEDARQEAIQEAVQRGDYKSALENTDISLGIVENKVSSLGPKAEILSFAALYDDAEATATEALRAHQLSYEPDNVFNHHMAHAHEALCNVYLFRQDWISLLKSASAISNFVPEWRDDATSYSTEAWLELNEPERALQDAQVSMTGHEDDPEKHYLIGRCLFALKRFEDAAKCFSITIKLINNQDYLSDYFGWRSLCYANLGRYDLAWDDFNAAQKLDKWQAQSISGAEIVLRATGNIVDADIMLRAKPISISYITAFRDYRMQSDILWRSGVRKTYMPKDAIYVPIERKGLAKLFSDEPIRKQFAQTAAKYFDILKLPEATYPGFTEFYSYYVTARYNYTLHKLRRALKDWFLSGTCKLYVESLAKRSSANA
jgi:tetratricopeptide (TPR) repeat protein